MFNRNYRNCGCMNDSEDSIYDNSCGMYANNDDYMSDCACGYNEPYSQFPSDPTLAESYIPTQYMNNVFKSCPGLKNGTMFPELVSCYEPGQSMKVIKYLRDTNQIGEGCNG